MSTNTITTEILIEWFSSISCQQCHFTHLDYECETCVKMNHFALNKEYAEKVAEAIHSKDNTLIKQAISLLEALADQRKTVGTEDYYQFINELKSHIL